MIQCWFVLFVLFLWVSLLALYVTWSQTKTRYLSSLDKLLQFSLRSVRTSVFTTSSNLASVIFYFSYFYFYVSLVQVRYTVFSSEFFLSHICHSSSSSVYLSTLFVLLIFIASIVIALCAKWYICYFYIYVSLVQVRYTVFYSEFFLSHICHSFPSSVYLFTFSFCWFSLLQLLLHSVPSGAIYYFCHNLPVIFIFKYLWSRLGHSFNIVFARVSSILTFSHICLSSFSTVYLSTSFSLLIFHCYLLTFSTSLCNIDNVIWTRHIDLFLVKKLEISTIQRYPYLCFLLHLLGWQLSDCGLSQYHLMTKSAIT